MRRALVTCVLGLFPASALAAGYDTPMLYSARHMGIGGAAIGYVNDPSAAFHNPAGFARLKGGAVMVDVSPLRGTIKASPNAHAEAKSIESIPAIAPLFLAGAGYRVWNDLVAGVSVFPVGSAAGGYEYPYEIDKKITTRDTATLAFIEVAPTLAYSLPMGFKIGATWRYTLATFQRKREQLVSDDPKDPNNIHKTLLGIDLDMKGTNTAGFRLGLQWSNDLLDVGVVYRNKLDINVHADDGQMLLKDRAQNVDFQFIFPSKVGFGAQFRGVKNLRLAADFEYAFNSENTETAVTGTVKGANPPEQKLKNMYYWEDGKTIRLGAAYALGSAEVRAGYARDTQVTQKKYPSAFGTPPADTDIFTAGAGYRINDAFDVSLAGAYRTGSATVAKSDLDTACLFCGKEGDYAIDLFGAYLDVVWRFGEPKPTPPPPSAAASEEGPSAPFTPPPGSAAQPPEPVKPEVQVEERKPDESPLPEPKDKKAKVNDPHPESEPAPPTPPK